MPRIQIDPNDCDKVFAIEEAIARVLREHHVARVSTKSIDMEYDVLNADDEPVSSSVEEKCAHLARKFNAPFEFKDGDVWFRKTIRQQKSRN